MFSNLHDWKKNICPLHRLAGPEEHLGLLRAALALLGGKRPGAGGHWKTSMNIYTGEWNNQWLFFFLVFSNCLCPCVVCHMGPNGSSGCGSDIFTLAFFWCGHWAHGIESTASHPKCQFYTENDDKHNKHLGLVYCWSTVVWEKPKRLLWFDCQAALWSGSRKQDSQSSNWWRPRGGFVPRKTGTTMPLRLDWRPWTQFVWARGLWNVHLQKKLAFFHCGAAAATLCKSNLPAGHAQAWCRCRRGSFLSQPACGGSEHARRQQVKAAFHEICGKWRYPRSNLPALCYNT